MPAFSLPDPAFESRVRSSFNLQRLMKTINAKLVKVMPGEVHIEIPFQQELTQQNGFIHAGIITSIVDSACGYAAFSLMASTSGVLTVEYKVNLLAPAIGERFLAIGRVRKSGRTLTVCEGDVFAHAGGEETLVATMLATMIRLTA
ncbi:MAG TPA: PaaI family thioesterase [Blastocatellia bacterium]|nr:PaaI family thioesterase [Blastocatellia bacterium]